MPEVYTTVLLIPTIEPGGPKGWKPLHAFNTSELAVSEILGDEWYVVRVESFSRARKTLIYLERT